MLKDIEHKRHQKEYSEKVRTLLYTNDIWTPRNSNRYETLAVNVASFTSKVLWIH